MSPRFTRYASVLLLLGIYLLTRLHNLMALPLFVDESIYIYRAQLIREGQILRAAQHSRTLHAWMTAFLGPDPPGGGWLARAAIVLLGLVGAAAFYGLVRSMISHRAGLIALIAWIAMPYLLLYERMALADPALSASTVIAVWFAWQMARTGRYLFALGTGLSLVGALLAKASGTSWLPLPLVALVLAAGIPWHKRLVLGVLAYGVFGVLFGAFYFVVRARGRSYFEIAERFVGGGKQSVFERTWDNLQNVWQFDLAYLGIAVIALAVLGAVIALWQRPRVALFALAALGMGGGGAIVFGRNVNSRYALNHAAWVVLLAVLGLGLLYERYPRTRPVIAIALAAWVALFAAPFAWDAWTDPAELPLAGNDRNEYVAQESSGFALEAIGERLSAQDERLPVLGFVANCEALRLYAHPAEVICPTIYWDVENAPRLMQMAADRAAQGALYIVGEDLLYLDLSALPTPHTQIATVERPGGLRPVTLYRIEQGAQQPD